MLLLEAQKYLEIVRKRGEAGSELRRVYYNIVTNRQLYLAAYAKLYANTGAMTPGTDNADTVDGMSLEKIDTIMKRLKNRKYVWKPTRRTYILKKDGKSKRPLGMPGWEDKMVQEVIRMVLEAYYEPQFRNCSHGFRPKKGCHSALNDIKHKWTGTQWFIEGDIKGCFDNLDHTVILNVLRQHVKDVEFLAFIEGMMKVGYVEDWKYYRTYSGTPQGGIVSPLLANVVLHELDTYIEDKLIPEYTQGKNRKRNVTYMKMAIEASKARKEGNYRRANELRKTYSKLPTSAYEDPNFRRLKYVRYADDFLLGFIGTGIEAHTIKDKIGKFSQKEITLEMSEEKTLITHAYGERARFLNYEITVGRSQNRREMNVCGNRTTKRTFAGQIMLRVPQDVRKKWKSRVTRKGKVIHRKELTDNSDYDIIMLYESQLQGLINYYELAQNVSKEMWKLRGCYKESLIKTLANKHQKNAAKIAKKYRLCSADGRNVVGIEVKRDGKKPLRATFGEKRIQRKKTVEMKDEIPILSTMRSQLIDRLLTEKCELCGEEGKVEGHHIKKLKDLSKKHRKLEPWEKRMIALRRKTLFVCGQCHLEIHSGSYDGKKLA